jgi:hypothetical protein
MDERTTQIREGAGQVESKLNTEFIDWLRKWHMPILLVVALAALSWVGYQRWQAARDNEITQAFTEMQNAQSPEALRSIAANYEGIRSVSEMARLRAADIYLQAFRTGVKPGSQPQPDGTFTADDLLGASDRPGMLEQAEMLYRTVLDSTSRSQAKALLGVGASFGLAAVAESRGELDAARQQYERTAELAEWGGFPGQAEIARERIKKLPELAQPPRLYAAAELPKPPATEPPVAFDPSMLNFDPLPPLGDPPAGEPPIGEPGAVPRNPGEQPPATPEPTPAPAPTPPPETPGGP